METVWQYKTEPKALCCPKCYHELPELEMKGGAPHEQNSHIYVTQTKCPNCKADIRVFWV
jgi:hypothetical protein